VSVRFILSDIDPQSPPRKKRRPIVNGEISLHWKPAPGHVPDMAVSTVFSRTDQPNVGGAESILEYLEELAPSESRENFQRTITADAYEIEDLLLIASSAPQDIPLKKDLDRDFRPFVVSVESTRDSRAEEAEYVVLCEGAQNLSSQDNMAALAEANGIRPTGLRRLVNECLDAGFIAEPHSPGDD
jgi:hypothetical protein